MGTSTIIQTSGLNYRYSGSEKAVQDLNLQVQEGSIYGFLGPNGSGKTTTLKLLLGLLKTQEGEIGIFGRSLQGNREEILKKIGSLVETPSLYGHLTARENLELYRQVYGASKSRVEEVLRMVDLASTGKKRARTFSLGMKQRLSLALALLPKPELLILDEPANGLDPSGIIELRELISRLNREEGMTILISSHILAEVEKVVSHLGIIASGKMVFQGTLDTLYHNSRDGGKLHLHTSDDTTAADLLRKYGPSRHNGTLTVSVQGKHEVAAISRLLHQHQLDVFLLHPQETNLEQLFINLTSTTS